MEREERAQSVREGGVFGFECALADVVLKYRLPEYGALIQEHDVSRSRSGAVRVPVFFLIEETTEVGVHVQVQLKPLGGKMQNVR